MQQARLFTAFLILVVCLAALGSAATTTKAADKKTTAKPKSTTTPPPPQVVESEDVDTLAKQIAKSVMDRIKKEPSAVDWNKTWSGQELADQFRSIWMENPCGSQLPNTSTEVALNAIKSVDTWTYETYFTTVFRAFWKYAVYLGERIRYPGTDNDYILLLGYERLFHPVTDLKSFNSLIYIAYDDFLSPKDYCSKNDAFLIIWLYEVERFKKEK